MTKEHKQLIVIAVGVTILAVVLIPQLKGEKKEKEGGDSAPEETVVSEEQESVPEKARAASRPKIAPAVLKNQQVAAARPYGRDPFALSSSARSERVIPKSVDTGAVSISMSLRAISVRVGAAPMAVINDSIIRVGDKIGDVEVAGIYKDYVLLKKNGKEYKLELEK